MATPDRGQRLLTSATVCVAAAAGALGLGRLFIGAEPRLQLLAFALVSVAVGAALQSRPLVLSAGVSIVAMVTLLGAVLVPESTWHLLPTPRSLEVLWGLAGMAASEMREQVAPTVALGGLMVVALSATWIAGWITHALAMRAKAPLAAALAPIALFVFGDAVIDEGSRPAFSGLLLFGVVAMIFADGLGRVLRWGPLEIWHGPSRRSGSVTLRATRGAWGVAAGALLVAMMAPAVLPGWEDPPVLHPRSGGSGGEIVDPLVSIRSELNRERPVVLFRVEASRPAYWRMLALATSDGSTWSTADLTAAGGAPVTGETDLMPMPSGATVLNEQRYEIVSLSSPWLPMAAEPIRADLGDLAARFDSYPTMVVVPDGTSEGDSYSVTSSVVQPQPDALDSAPDLSAATGRDILPPGFYVDNVGIGPVSPVVAELAERWTEGEPTPFRKLLAIQERLRNGFTYDEEVVPAEGVDALEWFLTDSRRGFCQQFAGAMATMARLLGYPARVAVGFLPGSDQGDGTWEVTTSDAHAWPEVYFEGIGWVAFEPTPGRANPAGTYLDPAFLAAGARSENASPAGSPRDRRTGPRWQQRHASETGFGEIPLPDEPVSWPRVAFIVAISLAILVMLLIPPTKAVTRWWRLRRARSPRKLVMAGYDVFAARLADVGLEREPGQTLREFGVALAPRSESVEPLVSAATRAAYSHQEMSADEARATLELARVARREVVRDVPLWNRLLGAFRVPSRYDGRSRSARG